MVEAQAFQAEAYPVHPVAPLHQVLAALQDPARLEMVRRLRNADTPSATPLRTSSSG